jgi:hypothetical protein
MTKTEVIFGTPIMVIDLPSNPDALTRIAEASKEYHFKRAKDDAEFAARTGRVTISRPDLLDDLSKEDKSYLLGPINNAVRHFIGGGGLMDAAASNRKLAVRGFARYYPEGGRIVPHTHFDADVVVSIYLQSGGTQGAPASDLILIDQTVRGYPHRAPFHRIPVRDGMAVIFPSYLMHETDPSPGERIIAGLEYKVIEHDMQKIFTPTERH